MSGTTQLESYLSHALNSGSFDDFFHQIENLKKEQSDLATKLEEERQKHELKKQLLQKILQTNATIIHKFNCTQNRYWDLKKQDSDIHNQILKVEKELEASQKMKAELDQKTIRLRAILEKLVAKLNGHRERMQPIHDKLCLSVERSHLVNRIRFMEDEVSNLSLKVMNLEAELESGPFPYASLERELKKMEFERERLECVEIEDILALDTVEKEFEQIEHKIGPRESKWLEELARQKALNQQMEAKIKSLELSLFKTKKFEARDNQTFRK